VIPDSGRAGRGVMLDGSDPVRSSSHMIVRRRSTSFAMLSLAGTLIAAALATAAIPHSSAAQNVIAYPAQGQSREQQDRDRFECYNWAVRQTGYNPQTQQYGSSAPPPPPPGTGVLPGAARGAAVGAIGGAIGGDAGKGAAIGAGVGGLFGGMRRREMEIQQQQAQAQQSAAIAQRNAGFNRAMASCLQGRGYSVN
jgi:hypothetical protein